MKINKSLILKGVAGLGFLGTIALAFKAGKDLGPIIDDEELSKSEKAKAISKKVAIPAVGAVVSFGTLYVSDKLKTIEFKRLTGEIVTEKSYDLIRAFDINSSDIYKRVVEEAQKEGGTDKLAIEEKKVYHIEELNTDVLLTDLEYITINYRILTDFLDIFLYGAGMIHDHEGLRDCITLQDYARYFKIPNYKEFSDVDGWTTDICGDSNGYMQLIETVSEDKPNVVNVHCVWKPDFLEHEAPVEYARG